VFCERRLRSAGIIIITATFTSQNATNQIIKRRFIPIDGLVIVNKVALAGVKIKYWLLLFPEGN